MGGGRWRRSKDCSSCTPAMWAKAKIEERCSTVGWRTICWLGSRQSSRRHSQISKELTKALRPRLQKQYRGHFGASIALRGKLQRIHWHILVHCQANTQDSCCSVTAFTYLQRSQVQAPRISRRFLDGIIDPSMTGHDAHAESLQVSAYALNSACDLSGWLYEAMTESGDVDPRARTRLYQNLRQWSSQSLSLIRADIKFRPEMYGLR